MVDRRSPDERLARHAAGMQAVPRRVFGPTLDEHGLQPRNRAGPRRPRSARAAPPPMTPMSYFVFSHGFLRFRYQFEALSSSPAGKAQAVRRRKIRRGENSPDKDSSRPQLSAGIDVNHRAREHAQHKETPGVGGTAAWVSSPMSALITKKRKYRNEDAG